MTTSFRWRFWGAWVLALRARHAACALAVAVAACQGMDEQPDTSIVDAKQSFIRFQHVDFDPELTEYAVARYRRTGNEFHMAKFFGADAFAVLAAYKTSPSYVMRERATKAYIAELLEDVDLDWGESGRTRSGFGQVSYRLFDVVGGPFSCVGFGQTVGARADDLGRKSDLVFGFFCHDNSRPMSTDAAEDLIAEVALTARR